MNHLKVYRRDNPGYCPRFVQQFASLSKLEDYLVSEGSSFSYVDWQGVEGRVRHTNLVLVEECDDFAFHASYD